MSNLKTPPFTFDIVGSFLRPAYLKEARADFAAGCISREKLTATEDRAISELVHKEKEIAKKISYYVFITRQPS